MAKEEIRTVLIDEREPAYSGIPAHYLFREMADAASSFQSRQLPMLYEAKYYFPYCPPPKPYGCWDRYEGPANKLAVRPVEPSEEERAHIKEIKVLVQYLPSLISSGRTSESEALFIIRPAAQVRGWTVPLGHNHEMVNSCGSALTSSPTRPSRMLSLQLPINPARLISQRRTASQLAMFNPTPLSRRLASWLRHRLDAINLELDSLGWFSIQQFLQLNGRHCETYLYITFQAGQAVGSRCQSYGAEDMGITMRRNAFLNTDNALAVSQFPTGFQIIETFFCSVCSYGQS
jgi:hypothetical protein